MGLGLIVGSSRDERRRLGFLAYRSMVVCDEILGLVEDAGPEGLRWLDLLGSPGVVERPEATMDGTVRDLVKFGALRVTGSPRRPRSSGARGDTRILRLTLLGEAWLEGELLPRPTDLFDAERAEEFSS